MELAPNELVPKGEGVCWQKTLRDKGGRSGQLNLWKPRLDLSPEVRRVNYDTAKQVILDYEWLGTMGNTEIAYGILWAESVGGVVCFGKTTSPHLDRGLCGPEYAPLVAQLTRGAMVFWAPPNSNSRLIGRALRLLKEDTSYRIVVAFADPRAGEIGTVYQATNWIYTGLTKIRHDTAPDFAAWGSKGFHIRGLPKELKNVKSIEAAGMTAVRRLRPRKHRYVYLLGTRKERKELRAALRYPVLSYPKR